MSGPLIVFGCGGHGRVVADAAAPGWQVLGFADQNPDNVGQNVAGLPVVAGSVDEVVRVCADSGASCVVAIGDNHGRMRVFDDLEAAGVPIATVVHPSAVIAPTAHLGVGSVLFGHVVVNPHARIGRNVILNTGATVDHDNQIGDHAHLSPGVHTGGTVRVGEGTHLGVGVAVRNNITIGAWSVVGVGAAVVADLPDHIVAYGTPARVVRANERAPVSRARR